MIRNKNFKKYLSVLFTGIYLFAFLFASNIHNHNGGYFYKDYNFKGSSSKFSKQNTVNNNDDCLSCHFASTSSLLPTSANFSITKSFFKSSVPVLSCAEKTFASYFNFFLRGPPNNFI
ncbi:hypothetical protein SAMN05443292_1542 [Halpernia frigidisoli]|uniref:Uncharacterized protein n=1 Tax=Halpernia frigidisoli TaxID=1125876 RepID=A0A1I3FQ38_9FLAO|nr:hypothetical protein SAMN05443292_1542 [Halpernia frigidisoli]